MFDLTDIAELKIEDMFNASPYIYNSRYVPRVTEIISKMIEEPGIRNWANRLGYQRKNYNEMMRMYAEFGSEVHETLEHIVKNLPLKEGYPYEPVEAFKIWWAQLQELGVEVLGSEVKLIGPYYGGTYDLLIKLKDKIWLVDYKTSNNITYKYWLQLSAYRKMLRELHNINIDGCLILQISKYTISYREWLLNLSYKPHQQYIDICERTFESLVYGFYHINYLEAQFDKEWIHDVSGKRLSKGEGPSIINSASS